MGIVDLAYKILPEDFFIYLRDSYYKLNKSIFKKLTEREFKHILTGKLGLTEGMVVFVHSSIDKLNLGFPPHIALDILLETLGDSGTIMFPAWQYSGRAEDHLSQNPVFNVRRTATVMGLLPEIARRHKNAFRSLHPTASIVAIGTYAEELVSEHHLDIYPCGEKSPMVKMLKYNSRIIGLGEKVVSLSFVHCVEDVMKKAFPVQTLQENVVEAKVINSEEMEMKVKTLIPHQNIRHRDNLGFIKKNVGSDTCKMFTSRGVNYYSCHAQKLFSEMKSLAGKGITIYRA
jgi:aminoglycoside 3-N-acetyltransferase